MNTLRRSLVLIATSAVAAGTAHGNDLFKITPLVAEGDAVTGVGNITSISNFAINNDASWVVEADTDAANTDADGVVLRDGALLLQENQALAAPLGALLDSFDTIDLNNAGDSGWNFFLDPFPSGLDSGIYFNTNLLIQEGDLTSAAGFTLGTPYIGFFECKTNDLNQMAMIASLDDPLISSTVDQGLILLQIDGSGNLASETVIAKEGDILPGQTAAVESFETGPHNFSLNNTGQLIYIAELAEVAAQDHAVYMNNTLLAQEGSVEPSTGRNWATLASAEVAVGDGGDWVLSGSLDGDSSSNLLIVKNGAKFRQEGDTLDAIAPFTLTSFGSGPVLVDEDGDVLWYGDWNDPDTDVDTGLFLNDTLLVQEGVTTIDGVVVDTLRGIQDGYAMSDNGRYIVFEAILANGVEGAFEIRQDGAVLPMEDCLTNAGQLAYASGTPFGGDTLTLEMDAGQSVGATAVLMFSVEPIIGWPPCGIDLGGPGELLISIFSGNPVATFFDTWNGSPTSFGVPIPPNEAQIGLHLYTQGVFVDLGSGTEPYRLTKGLEVILGDFL